MSDEFNPRTYIELFSAWENVNSEFFGERWDFEDKPERKTWLGDEPEFIFAYYNYENYSGDSTVVFKKDGKWFLNSAGHCSCYGLEGKWDPEEFDPAQHFLALEQGKRLISVIYDWYGEEPSELNKQFDAWLALAWSGAPAGARLVTRD